MFWADKYLISNLLDVSEISLKKAVSLLSFLALHTNGTHFLKHYCERLSKVFYNNVSEKVEHFLENFFWNIIVTDFLVFYNVSEKLFH